MVTPTSYASSKKRCFSQSVERCITSGRNITCWENMISGKKHHFLEEKSLVVRTFTCWESFHLLEKFALVERNISC